MNIIGEMANYKIREAISYFQEKKKIKRLHKITIGLKKLTISKQMQCFDSCGLEYCSNLQFDSLES